MVISELAVLRWLHILAMVQSLRRLKDTGISQSPDQAIFDFMEFCQLIGFNEVWDFENKWVQK